MSKLKKILRKIGNFLEKDWVIWLLVIMCILLAGFFIFVYVAIQRFIGRL